MTQKEIMRAVNSGNIKGFNLLTRSTLEVECNETFIEKAVKWIELQALVFALGYPSMKFILSKTNFVINGTQKKDEQCSNLPRNAQRGNWHA